MISVVLMEPETSGNLGSIARAMANFGFDDLVLVNPKCLIDEDSMKFAMHAKYILKGARIVGTDALKNFDYLIATTSKLGRNYNMPRVPITPDQLGKKLASIQNSKIAIVLGREGDGLYNKELEMCDFVVTIPTSKQYDSMNISHALAIILYELQKQEFSNQVLKPYTPMSGREKEQVMTILDKAMKGMDFASEEKRDTQRRVWKRMITKAFLTRTEALALMGFLKKIK